MNKITVAKSLWHLPIAIAFCTMSGSALAFPGDNNPFFGGSNNGCGTDWPVWTPMYWMEEMVDAMRNNSSYDNCYPFQAYGAYPPQTYNPYAPAITPAQAMQYRIARNPAQILAYRQRALSPYALRAYPLLRQQISPWSGIRSRTSSFPFSTAFGGQRGSLSNLFGGRKNSSIMPFSSGFGSSNPFSSVSPMGSFGSPFGAGMSPLGMGGMGMPGMSPMSGMGMSPMGGGFSPFGGSPFGGSSFMPKF